MILNRFDVRGEEISDDVTEEIIRKGDPHRSLVRYQRDGSELLVYVRLNMALLQAAISLPILLVKPHSREDEVFRDTLTVLGSVRNYELLERICGDVSSASFPACYIGEQHGTRRRDFFFVTEDVAGFERIARTAAEALAFPLTIEQYRLAELAPLILAPMQLSRNGNHRWLRPVRSYPTLAGTLRHRFIHRLLSPHLRPQGRVEGHLCVSLSSSASLR